MSTVKHNKVRQTKINKCKSRSDRSNFHKRLTMTTSSPSQTLTVSSENLLPCSCKQNSCRSEHLIVYTVCKTSITCCYYQFWFHESNIFLFVSQKHGSSSGDISQPIKSVTFDNVIVHNIFIYLSARAFWPTIARFAYVHRIYMSLTVDR